MNPSSPIRRILLRSIIILYFCLFITALVSSGYFLMDIVASKPIPALGLFKYLLLCVLFIILSVNAARALTLDALALNRFAESIKNFKWLFAIAVVISVAAKLGLFTMKVHQDVQVSGLQIGLLVVLAVFCFWSDGLLKEVVIKEETEEQDSPPSE